MDSMEIMETMGNTDIMETMGNTDIMDIKDILMSDPNCIRGILGILGILIMK